jgi:hypothetical protein
MVVAWKGRSVGWVELAKPGMTVTPDSSNPPSRVSFLNPAYGVAV